MLTFVAKLTVQAGKEREFEEKMRAVVPMVREEPGNRTYIMHRSIDHPRVFVFYEEYTDQAAFDAHRRHLHELGVDLRAFLDGPPVLEFYKKLAS
jgi:quinol monooxygenase YgiN